MDPLQEYSTALSGIANAYRKSQTLFTAVELDVFSLLTPAAPAEHVAEKTGCSLRGVRMLLDALVAMELLWKGEGRSGNTPMAEACARPARSGPSRATSLPAGNTRRSVPYLFFRIWPTATA